MLTFCNGCVLTVDPVILSRCRCPTDVTLCFVLRSGFRFPTALLATQTQKVSASGSRSFGRGSSEP